MLLLKYPRTRHLEGSRLQTGDSPDQIPLSALRDTPLVIEEKLDGANAAVSFDAQGQLLLQSRGHYLTGGTRERHFAFFKTWAAVHQTRLHAALGARYVMYGEWLYAKHTVFYDHLPHYFHEFDLFDRTRQVFLSTPARRAVLHGLPIMPVPVLATEPVQTRADLVRHVRPSLYKTADWRTALASAAQASGSRPDMVDQQTEDSDLAEGVYIKTEADGIVTGRYKYVRAGFHQAIQEAEGHWQDRPILPNGLRADVDILSPQLSIRGAYDDPQS